MRTLSCFVTLAALLASVAAARTSVIVSFQPYETVTRNIAGPDAEVTRLVPIGASPHEFEPKPSDLRRVAAAKIVFVNGLGLDEWIVKLTRASGTKARVVEIGERVNMTPLRGQAPTGEEHGHADEHGAVDPHIWLDASIMAKAASVIGEELAKADPARANAYRARAKLEHSRLMKLHTELKALLSPVRAQKVVTFHGAWGYWSRAYGPVVAAVVEPFPGKEPSAKYVRDVVKLLRARRAQAVFAEPQLPSGPARVIAESAGVKLFVIAPEGTAQHPDYYAMMRANARTFLQALKSSNKRP